MQRYITSFLVGSVAGAALISASLAFGPESQPPEMIESTTPSPEPQVSPSPLSSPKPLTERTERVLDGLLEPLQDLERKLYEEGVTTYGTVETVFDGAGFIVRDELGSQIFVQWTADPPEDGQDIVVKGILQSIAQGQEENITQEPTAPRLQTFLRNHQTLIRAEELHRLN